MYTGDAPRRTPGLKLSPEIDLDRARSSYGRPTACRIRCRQAEAGIRVRALAIADRASAETHGLRRSLRADRLAWGSEVRPGQT